VAAVVIRVLGKSPAATDAGGACSGYLLSQDGFTLLLDCGSGVFGRLRELVDYEQVDAVLISHLHADHFLDLIPFSFALKYSPRAPLPRPKLWAPPGAGNFFQRLGDLIRFDDQIASVFELSEYAGGEELKLGPFTIRFTAVPHYIETYACDITTPTGTRLTFGADCGPNEELQDLARDTDLLLVEATSQNVPGPEEMRGHMTAREAGELAAAASARQVVITHFSDELDVNTVRAEAEAGFGAAVALAHEGAVYTI
jgi:ribonuclease BN (tRNA processing enzyme)